MTRSLGADLRGGRLAVLAIEASWPEFALPAPQRAATHVEANQEARRLAARAAVAADLRQAATRRACGALVGLVGNRILGVVSVPGVRPISTVLEEIVEEAARRGVEREQRVELVAGASGETPADALPKAADEAMAALAVGRRSGRTRRLHHFGELGTYQLLLRLAQGPHLAQFVESELRGLLDHDARARTRLLPTLRAYLEHAGRKPDTIRALGIQRRTLYARLAKLEGLLGRDLDMQDARTRLTLAIQGLELLDDMRTRHTR